MIEWDKFIPIVLAFMAAVPGLLALKSNNAKLNAEAKSIEAETTERVMKMVGVELDKMQRKLDERDKTIADMQDEMARLRVDNENLRAENKSLRAKLEELERKAGGATGRQMGGRA